MDAALASAPLALQQLVVVAHEAETRLALTAGLSVARLAFEERGEPDTLLVLTSRTDTEPVHIPIGDAVNSLQENQNSFYTMPVV